MDFSRGDRNSPGNPVDHNPNALATQVTASAREVSSSRFVPSSRCKLDFEKGWLAQLVVSVVCPREEEFSSGRESIVWLGRLFLRR